MVSATIERLTDDLCSTGRTHGEYGDTAVGVLLLDAERLLERIQILGVKDSVEGGTVHSAVSLHSIFADITCVGDLLGKYDDIFDHI